MLWDWVGGGAKKPLLSKTYHTYSTMSVAKGLKWKFRMFLGLIPIVVEVTWEKLVSGMKAAWRKKFIRSKIIRKLMVTTVGLNKEALTLFRMEAKSSPQSWIGLKLHY